MTKAGRRLPYLLRLVRSRPRLFNGFAIALLVMPMLPSQWRWATRVLVAWDVGIASYLVLVYHLIAGSRVSDIRQRAEIEDEGRLGTLVLTVAAALASLGAIIAELGPSAAEGTVRQPPQLILAMLTILLSWAFIHTIFALHYAHDFYGDGGNEGGLEFPGGEKPDYWDFVYFAFVIGMTSQVSDIAISSRSIRRTATAHGIVSFVFNAALLALTVNVAASEL
jgi:uncharacterized membrane protein